jgi:hypothetical protein
MTALKRMILGCLPEGSSWHDRRMRVALQRCRDRGVRRITVSTAAADTGNLRFYQRQGFRMLRIDRDVFGPDAGYAEGIVIDGIPLRDRVWLDQELC